MGMFYLRFRGTVTGPYADAELRRMLDRELVTAGHEVSADRVSWAPVHGGTLLPGVGQSVADAFREDDETPSFDDELTGFPAEGPALPPAASPGSDRLPLVAGVSCGLLVMYLSFIPVGPGPVFWWSAEAGALIGGAAALVLGMAAAASVLMLPPLRSSVMIVLAAAGLIMLLVSAVDGGWLAVATIVQVPAAAVAACLLGTALASGAKRSTAVPAAALVAAAAILFTVIACAIPLFREPSSASARFALVQGAGLIMTSAAWATLLTISLAEHLARARLLRPVTDPSA